jgi:hypothetical protein
MPLRNERYPDVGIPRPRRNTYAQVANQHVSEVFGLHSLNGLVGALPGAATYPNEPNHR